MRHILYYDFLNDVVEKLEYKYKNILKSEENRFFLYANIIEFPYYYSLYSSKKNQDYNLVNKLHKVRVKETIELIVNEVLENNYSTKYLSILYGYISNIILDSYLDEYIKGMNKRNFNFSLTKKNYMFKYSKYLNGIARNFFNEKHQTKIKKKEIFKNLITTLDSEELILMDMVFSKIYYFSYGKIVLEKSYKNFIKYEKRNFKDIFGIKKFSCYLKDKFSRTKKFSTTILSTFRINKFNHDYLNYNKKYWEYGFLVTNKTFFDLYQEALTKASNILNELSYEIFYKKNIKDTFIDKISNLINSK